MAGEHYFSNVVSKMFCDISSFEIMNKSKCPRCSDFWLMFEKFTIMVDSKNYIDNPVPSKDRVKLKNNIYTAIHILKLHGWYPWINLF